MRLIYFLISTPFKYNLDILLILIVNVNVRQQILVQIMFHAKKSIGYENKEKIIPSLIIKHKCFVSRKKPKKIYKNLKIYTADKS